MRTDTTPGAPDRGKAVVTVAELGHLADGRDPPGVELRRGHAADTPEPLDRQQMQEGQFTAGGHEEQAVGPKFAAQMRKQLAD